MKNFHTCHYKSHSDGDGLRGFTIEGNDTRRPNRKWNSNMMYVALPMRAQTEKTEFSCTYDCMLTKHTRRWTYSPLRLQYDLCRTSFVMTGF